MTSSSCCFRRPVLHVTRPMPDYSSVHTELRKKE